MAILRMKRITLGIVAVILWIVGAILPVMPGWPFLLFAVFILSRDVPPVRPLRNWLDRKHPAIGHRIGLWECKLGLLSPEEIAALDHPRA